MVDSAAGCSVTPPLETGLGGIFSAAKSAGGRRGHHQLRVAGRVEGEQQRKPVARYLRQVAGEAVPDIDVVAARVERQVGGEGELHRDLAVSRAACNARPAAASAHWARAV